MNTKMQNKIDEYEEYNKNCRLIIETRQFDIDEANEMIGKHSMVIEVLKNLLAEKGVAYRCDKYLNCGNSMCEHRLQHKHVSDCDIGGCTEYSNSRCVTVEV